jgi:hypothetical protein
MIADGSSEVVLLLHRFTILTRMQQWTQQQLPQSQFPLGAHKCCSCYDLRESKPPVYQCREPQQDNVTLAGSHIATQVLGILPSECEDIRCLAVHV